MKKQAFSLVELSIVLVIVGLLAGGILAGKTLIHAAELRAVTAEYQLYSTAEHAFQDKYLAIPGDMPNATQFWGYLNGSASNCTANMHNIPSTSGTCDGNGDGSLGDLCAAIGGTWERLQFWRQLALAGLIDGSYDGTQEKSGAGCTENPAPTMRPPSKFNSGYWSVGDPGAVVSVAFWDEFCSGFYGAYGNSFFLSASSASGINTQLFDAEDLWNIDTKLDDGLPGQGKVVAGVPVFGNLAICTTATNPTQTNATYNLTNTNIGCVAIFRQQF